MATFTESAMVVFIKCAGMSALRNKKIPKRSLSFSDFSFGVVYSNSSVATSMKTCV